ncbi:hypothetical protein KAR91_66370 [Candidatus Pacearchaeota archaeon]|nr:hypothetical protein [Candidatus Pacearchaeota archaeon]
MIEESLINNSKHNVLLIAFSMGFGVCFVFTFTLILNNMFPTALGLACVDAALLAGVVDRIKQKNQIVEEWVNLLITNETLYSRGLEKLDRLQYKLNNINEGEGVHHLRLSRPHPKGTLIRVDSGYDNTDGL